MMLRRNNNFAPWPLLSHPKECVTNSSYKDVAAYAPKQEISGREKPTREPKNYHARSNARGLDSLSLGFIFRAMPGAKSVSALARVLGSVAALSLSLAAGAKQEQLTDNVSGPPIDPELAIKQFKAPAGFKIDLFAAEPQLMNPVSFCLDEQGRLFVAETFRYRTSAFDIRQHMNIYYDDLASRTVEDRAQMIQRFLGGRGGQMTAQSEVVRLLEDRLGTGKADFSTVFADGFNSILDGIGSGVLARKGKLYYADIPNLWLLQDSNHQGKADVRASLSYGYGVHFGYAGHDLHGLRIGPDGRLYFSIGDRGLHVTTKEGKVLDYPDTGAVLRCNLDGSELEVFASGLRNPQALDFDDHGNLFTGDNNCDQGDASRLVYVVEGGDSGWRNAYQISETTPGGVWNSEMLWHLQFPGQAAYILPPVAFLGQGPAGLVHYPGTGFPAAYQDRFFMCDFQGASVNSGIYSFSFREKGAGFDLAYQDQFFWHILATDVAFGPDGKMYVSDWVRSWGQPGLGRIYRLYDTSLAGSASVLETKKLIAEGMGGRSAAELEALLGHADQRMRQEAQFELADRCLRTASLPEECRSALTRAAFKGSNLLARLHGIWGLGQVGRSTASALQPILPLLEDSDAEVRAQTAKVLGEARLATAFAGLTNLLTDANLRVRFFAAQSLGKLGGVKAVGPLLAMLQANADRDVFLRHAGVMGLLGTADKSNLVLAAADDSRSVRMAALLVMRRRQLPEIANFLHDSDPLLVLEAARAINDVPILSALPQLAALVQEAGGSEMLDWRAVNANFRLGHSAALAAYAANTNALESLRGEALQDLATWPEPPPRDRVTGFWRPMPVRDAQAAADAVAPVMDQLLRAAPDGVRFAALVVAVDLDMTTSAAAVLAAAKDSSASSDVRLMALRVLARFNDPHLAEAVKTAVTDKDPNVRRAVYSLQAAINPGEALGFLKKVVENGTVPEKQDALAAIGTMEGAPADNLFSDWLDKLIHGRIPREIQFDLLQAARARKDSALVQEKLKQYKESLPNHDELAGYRETLYGGDAAAGKKIFTERSDASCVRCHKVQGIGGKVGPDLTGIITRHDREYILESILFPNKSIAPGYESQLVEMADGQTYAGIVKNQTENELTLLSIEDNTVVKLKKSGIKRQIIGQSPMPAGMGTILSKQDLRNLVEFLATLK
jgi:quinoprotein glucose dehydrogenase